MPVEILSENPINAYQLKDELAKIKWGQEKQKIIIEDPSGNSAIIDDKAEKSGLKVKTQ